MFFESFESRDDFVLWRKKNLTSTSDASSSYNSCAQSALLLHVSDSRNAGILEARQDEERRAQSNHRRSGKRRVDKSIRVRG